MSLLYQEPPNHLRPFISAFVNLEFKEGLKDYIPVLPNGHSYFTYSYLSPGHIFRNDEKIILPKFYVSGQSTNDSIKIYFNKSIGQFGVEFTPSGFYKLFHLPMSRLLNNFIDFEEYVLTDDRFFSELSKTQTFSERIEVATYFFTERSQYAVQTERVDMAVDILGRQPNTLIAEIADEIGTSERQLRRDFIETVGVTPKAFAKIRQIKEVLKLIDADDKKLKEYAYNCGYYDTAHFVRSFNKMLGKNPTAFIESYDGFLKFYLAEAR